MRRAMYAVMSSTTVWLRPRKRTTLSKGDSGVSCDGFTVEEAADVLHQVFDGLVTLGRIGRGGFFCDGFERRRIACATQRLQGAAQ